MSLNVKYGSIAFSGIGNDPLVSFDTEINRSSAGYIIGVNDKIKLNGVIFSTGILNGSGTDDSKSSWVDLIDSYNVLRTGLKDYNSLTIQCNDSEIYKSDANSTIVESINFNNQKDENWLRIIDYTITFSVANTGYQSYIADSGYYISDFQDSYSIQTQDDPHYYQATATDIGNKYPYGAKTEYLPHYKISRTLSANGIQTSGRSAVDNAKLFISGIAASNPKINSIVSTLTVLDRSLNININRIDGSYGITDNFIAVSGLSAVPWYDTFTINSEIDMNLRRTINIQGVVKGLNTVTGLPNIYNNVLDNTFASSLTGNKYANASGGFYGEVQPSIFARALQVVYPTGSLSGLSQQYYTLNTGLNPIPKSVNVDHNMAEGTIGYTYSYDSRPLSLISGAIIETINMEDSYATRSYHMQDVFYRMPLPQDMGTYSIPTRTITYDATFPRPLSGVLPSTVKAQLENLIEQFNPKKLTASSASTMYGPGYFSWLVGDEDTYDILNGKYTKKYSWQYQKGHFPQGFY